MPDTLISANMSLPIPIVGQDPGPQFATDTNSCLTILDGHNHTPGLGVAIPPNGLNINSDLTFQSNNATLLRSVRFDPQASPLALGSDIGCLYESGVDLYYNDGNGNQIRITQSGSVVGAPGTITGLVPPASVTYIPGTQTFVFQSAVATPANLDGGSLIIREVVANAKGITLASPSSLAADYQITFPGALPTSQKIVTLDSSGNLAANYIVDNSTIEIASNVIRVKALGITAAQIANATITTTQIAAATILGSNIATTTINGSNIVNHDITNTQLAQALAIDTSLAIGGGSVITPSGSSYQVPIGTFVTGPSTSSGLRVVRGRIDLNGNILEGEGFTVTHPSAGAYPITFTQAFGDTPCMVGTLEDGVNNLQIYSAPTSTTTGDIRVRNISTGTATNSEFSFIAIGLA